MHPYKNSTTFISMESIDQIPVKDRVILDSYLFDINELVYYATDSPSKLFINPYQGAGKFSAEAIKLLRSLPELKDTITRYEEEKKEQIALILPETVKEVESMLMEISKNGIEGEADPRIAFILFREKLPQNEQEALNNYDIEIKCNTSNLQKSRSSSHEAVFAFGQKTGSAQITQMQFSQALIGGGTGTPCVKTLQAYLWKFVLDFDPTALSRIPTSVKELALRNGYQLSTDTSPLSSSYRNITNSLYIPKKSSPSLDAIGEEEEDLESNAHNTLVEEDDYESDQDLTEKEDDGLGTTP